MITLIPKRKPKPIAQRGNTEHRAREEIGRHIHFRGRTDGFQFEHQDGVLTVHGRVPSFFLKEVLERTLQRVDGVRHVDNQVDVVCSDGLSSVRAPSSRFHCNLPR